MTSGKTDTTSHASCYSELSVFFFCLAYQTHLSFMYVYMITHNIEYCGYLVIFCI